MGQLTRAFGAALLLAVGVVPAQTSFTFEDATPFADARWAGNEGDFAVSSAQNHEGGGAQSLAFSYPSPPRFTSFTYEVPITLTEGTISVWFQDAVGAAGAVFPPGGTPEWGGSIILEDANNPADFGAVEICNLGYGGSSYFGSEGTGDRQAASDTFDTGTFGTRTVGWHQVVFTVGATQSTVSVDGNTSVQIGAPGGDKTLRLRFMIGSASNGGFGNWYTTVGEPTGWNVRLTPWVTYDDVAFTATAPSAASASLGFESGEVDSPAVFMGPSKTDNPFMDGFVPAFGITTDVGLVHAGTQAAYFDNDILPFRSVTLDLSGSNEGTATLWFYDSLGPDTSFDRTGGSIIIEDGSNPSNFMALEINNWPYPSSSDPTPGVANYYLSGSAGFQSRYFGDRQVGWNRLDIVLTNGSSRFLVNGIENSQGTGVLSGPGLSTSPKLRIMADSASSGGFSNWTTIDPLDVLYQQSSAPYVFYDEITVPASSSVSDWASFE
ncbi:hypothetical protein GC173_18045 [bacterium]|nr:hypothetical protein [bacterium]